MSRARAFVFATAAVAAVAASAVLFACSQTPTSVAIRTFERAQRVDVICLRVFGENAPEPLKQEECAPVPPNVNGGNLDNQLFALVTQTSRGEVAVVDLSAGAIIDQSHAVPGLNFLPVGANPTDVAATPDGRMAFVASAEPNKFAIYGIPGHRILGDAAGRRDPEGAVTLSSWPVCSLPQRPGSLTVVPRRSLSPVTADGGADDAGAQAATPTELPYELVAVLPGDRTTSAKVITIDPRPFLRASPRLGADGKPLEDFGAGPTLAPGQLDACPITAAMELVGESAVPDTFREGKKWEDGVKWVDGGVDLTCDTPEQPASCGLRPCKCKDPTTGLDAGTEIDAGGGVVPACAPDAGSTEVVERAFELGPLDPPQPVAIARDDQTLYIADKGIPLIHVVDLSVPGAPRELPPLVVSSSIDPSRSVSVGELAISPPTREYKRFLYAVDRKEGSIAVFDVTDPGTGERTPLRRPHPELNPFQPPDRIAFEAPVVAVAFARHDFPLTRINGVTQANAKTGLLCNPNPNPALEPDKGDAVPDFGVFYRANLSNVDVGLGPVRLRGIFAFATLSNGKVVAIDVDDWDAPCRRPQDLIGGEGTNEGLATTVSALAVAQPAPTGEKDYNPYHAPRAAPDSVSQEAFFPVSAPHRPRSNYLLREDAVSGRHTPFLQSTPTLTSTGAVTPPLQGPGSEATPKMRPTATRPGGLATGTEDVGVRFSLDTPEVHFDQDWEVTYEGKLLGFEGLPATISTNDGYSSLILSQPQARFCSKGVEDWSVGAARANAVTNALAIAGRPPHPAAEPLGRRMVDYVQISDDLLPAGDAFWRQPDIAEPNSCWDERLNPANPSDPRQVEIAARDRFDQCSKFFGASVSEQKTNRDFPILEAYDDHLVIGRFASFGENLSREVVYSDPSNARHLKMMRCCFHHQARFEVRANAQWVTVGSTVGFLNHITRGEGGRCVTSCDPREALLNARAPSLPYGASSTDFAPFRDSPLAMRNPAFSFFIQEGHLDAVPERPSRDMAFRFQTRGQFQPLLVNLAATTTGVSPQSMRFIESLGQIAVVDGASQGLVLIDLAGVTIARAPYF